MRIDHKDEPGDYRRAVFDSIQREFDFLGKRAADETCFIGDWTYRYHVPTGLADKTACVSIGFHPDGTAPNRAADGSFDNPKDRWAFNEDKSLSLWSYVEPMPEYGIDEPTYSEDRYHVLVKDDAFFVLFNGDGSLVMVYEKAAPTA